MSQELVYIHYAEGAVGCSIAIPTDGRGFGGILEVDCDRISDVTSYAQGYLQGILTSKGLPINSVVFQPADTICQTNTIGKPIYVFEVVERGKRFYQFHCFFTTKAEALRYCNNDQIVPC